MNSCGSSIFKFFSIVLLFFSGFSTLAQSIDTLKQRLCVNQIILEGNKITRDRIIYREITFHKGDSLSEHELRNKCLRWQQNLMNTSLYVFDTVYFRIDTLTKNAQVRVSVKERWYIWPGLIFQVQDRNFNSWWQTKDYSRINYGANLIVYNLFGLNQTLVASVQKGYTNHFGISYQIPYLDRKQRFGLRANLNFYQNNQLWYATQQNELQYYGNTQQFARTEQSGMIGITHRHGLYLQQGLDFYYNRAAILDTVVKLNNNYFAPGQTAIQYLSLQYHFRYAYRDYKPYPTKGYDIEAYVSKDGFNVLKNETPNNLAAFVSFKNYYKIFKRTFFMYALKGRYLFQYNPMYYFNKALGYGELVRGYEYYVIDGQNFGLLKANVRYQIMKPHVVRLPIHILKKFSTISYTLYGGPFVDLGYVQDQYFYKTNPLANQWLGGAGLGLDLVTYYDLVVRAEVTMNRMQQTGIFLHLNAPL